MTLKINITQNDIAKAVTACQGGTWLTEGCPVAQALMRRFPGSYVNVAFHSVWIDDVKYLASSEVDEFTMSPSTSWSHLKPSSFKITNDEFVPPTRRLSSPSVSFEDEDEHASQS